MTLFSKGSCALNSLPHGVSCDCMTLYVFYRNFLCAKSVFLFRPIFMEHKGAKTQRNAVCPFAKVLGADCADYADFFLTSAMRHPICAHACKNMGIGEGNPWNPRLSLYAHLITLTYNFSRLTILCPNNIQTSSWIFVFYTID